MVAPCTAAVAFEVERTAGTVFPAGKGFAAFDDVAADKESDVEVVLVVTSVATWLPPQATSIKLAPAARHRVVRPLNRLVVTPILRRSLVVGRGC